VTEPVTKSLPRRRRGSAPEGRPGGARSSTPDTRPEAPGTGETHVLRVEGSKAGRTVRLTLDRGSYQGAQPYYTVAYLKPSGQPQVLRYTPFRARAGWLFDRFCEDVTDPAKLADKTALPASETVANPVRRPCGGHRPVWRLACRDCNPSVSENNVTPDTMTPREQREWETLEAGIRTRGSG
jgi:hypothetical protein